MNGSYLYFVNKHRSRWPLLGLQSNNRLFHEVNRSSMIMRRLAQFVRLACVGRLVRRSSCASRVSRLSVCVSRASASVRASVVLCVSRLSVCVSRASASVRASVVLCVSRLASCLASVCLRLASVRLCVGRLASRICLRASVCVYASVHVKGSECVHLSASRICLRASVCVYASVHVKGSECVHLSASRVCASMRLASVRLCVGRLVSHLSACICLRLCVCLSLCVSRLSRVCVRVRLASACVCVSRLCVYASVVLSRVCLLVNACGVWLILCRSSFKEFKRFLLSSYYLIMSQCQSIHPIT